ncbi:TonB-dependent siderophore receptor [Sphingomonas sp. GC_Shp_3]|uniref:TonB-dependent siderophore receptor n=1 Tax=Sphingomonas sp. GC_Shp_3 TaxID=2937383 RepID=UPI00226A4E96|nr:TonB-dependent siderophore receptor [Sphingomonas sp. GC_Shp_3]
MKREIFAAMLLGSVAYGGPAFADVASGSAIDDQDTIVVQGERPSTESSAGTKNPAPIAETPQSISVISSALIADLGLSNLNQALRFVAGVTTEQRGSSAEVYDQFKLRGFDAPQFLDGLKVTQGAGYLASQVDVSRLERVEVVKGPASALYGQSGPGGLIALSSKLPLDQALYGAVSGTYGSYDLYRVDGDIGGKAGGVLWRVYGSVNGAHTQQTFSARERETISGAVTLGSGHATTLTLLGAYSHDPQNGSYSVFPASGTYLANPNGTLPTSRDFGEKGNYFRREQVAGTYILNHDFGDGWAFRASGRYQHATSRLGIVYSSSGLDASDPTGQTYSRASYATRETGSGWVFDNRLSGSFDTGPFKHDVLLGVDHQFNKAYELSAFGGATPLNGFAPVYGTMMVPDRPDAVPANFGVTPASPRQTQTGIYAQDQISVGGLRVLLSGRQDWADTRAMKDDAPENSKRFTYRAGALYTTSFGLAPYASYSTSFEPQSGIVTRSDGTLGAARPSLGKQLEFGAKYTVPGTKILLTGAWFHINQTNVVTSNPITFAGVQGGEVRSEGFEIEANAPLPHDFNARLAFSRQKVRTVKDTANPATIGNGILGVGRGGTSFNLEWAPHTGTLEGFAIGGAVRQVDSITASSTSLVSTPGFTVFDALARYDLGKFSPRLEGLTLGINAQNVFDKKYVTTCYLDYAWCWYGNRRTVQGTIGYRF